MHFDLFQLLFRWKLGLRLYLEWVPILLQEADNSVLVHIQIGFQWDLEIHMGFQWFLAFIPVEELRHLKLL